MKGYIDNREVEFGENLTILQVARENGVSIPTLCELRDLAHTPGTCRVCLVNMRRAGGEPRLVTSCDTLMEEGMRIDTKSAAVREARRLQVQFLMADHDLDCITCARKGRCELTALAEKVGLAAPVTRNANTSRPVDASSSAIVRDERKCVRCLRCVEVCRNVQGVDALIFDKTGRDAAVGVRGGLPQGHSACASCGQCTLVCPVGALAEKDDIETVYDWLADPELTTVFQFAPAVRAALGEEFGMMAGVNVQGRIVTALRRLGADVVLDTNFAADLVVMEEGSELLGRMHKGGQLPLFTSCCPGWVNFAEKNFPEILPHISTTRSPQQCLGSLAKTYMAESMGVAPGNMRVVSIMPCTAKKDECARPEFAQDGIRDVDAVLTTREFARLIRREGLNLAEMPDAEFDSPLMGDWTGAAVIFGATGGVMEAALRTVHKVVTGKELPGVDYEPVRGLQAVREAEVALLPEAAPVKVCVVHGLKAARTLVEDVLAGRAHYDFVEVMACPGGCLSGGGQPRIPGRYQPTSGQRRACLFGIDEKRSVRQSHNNPQVQKLYADYLGEPNSHRAHELLHTAYRDRRVSMELDLRKIWAGLKS